MDSNRQFKFENVVAQLNHDEGKFVSEKHQSHQEHVAVQPKRWQQSNIVGCKLPLKTNEEEEEEEEEPIERRVVDDPGETKLAKE